MVCSFAFIKQQVSVLCYTFITYFASYLALRYVIFEFCEMSTWTQNFYLRLGRPTADHDASRLGRPSGLPGGPCASSVIILPP